MKHFSWTLGLFLFLLSVVNSPCRAADRVTILYDAFGENKQLTKDWGFSALIEHDGKKILFDTGNNAELFQKNVESMSIDLTKLDFVVISHRHTDHTSGLKYVLKVNPKVPIYVPADGFNGFGGIEIPSSFFRADAGLPSKLQYYDGDAPKHVYAGKLYEAGNFILVDKTTEVVPGIFLVFTLSKTPGSLELPELTLALKTPQGLVLVDGCSHAGLDEILKAAATIDPHTHIFFGGLHLVRTPPEEVDALVERLLNTWKPDKIAPGHCTGEPAFLRLQKAFGERFVYAGLGSRILVD